MRFRKLLHPHKLRNSISRIRHLKWRGTNERERNMSETCHSARALKPGRRDVERSVGTPSSEQAHTTGTKQLFKPPSTPFARRVFYTPTMSSGAPSAPMPDPSPPPSSSMASICGISACHASSCFFVASTCCHIHHEPNVHKASVKRGKEQMQGSATIHTSA